MEPEPVVFANLSLIRKSVRLPDEGTVYPLQITSVDIPVDRLLSSSVTIHRTSPNTYDVVFIASTAPEELVAKAEQDRLENRAQVFESLDLPEDD